MEKVGGVVYEANRDYCTDVANTDRAFLLGFHDVANCVTFSADIFRF